MAIDGALRHHWPARARATCRPIFATSCVEGVIPPDRKEIAHFTLSPWSLYRASPVSAGYGDKLRCAIGTADPGAVPGGSTKNRAKVRVLTGPNQDRRVLKGTVFARAE